MIADRAYDSDPLRARLAARGIELIAPHRWNRSKPCTQDGRTLRRYRRRWKIERTFAWLGNYRQVAELLHVPVSWVYGRMRKRSLKRLPSVSGSIGASLGRLLSPHSGESIRHSYIQR